jgi:hypothetical protein
MRIVEALGGTRALATECSVSTWTVRAWLTGGRTPTPSSQAQIDSVARRLDLPAPYASRSGPRFKLDA